MIASFADEFILASRFSCGTHLTRRCRALLCVIREQGASEVDAIPDIKTLPEQGATSKYFTAIGFTGWTVPKATPQPIVDRLAELFVAANTDPKVKEVLATFGLGPALGFKESNAHYQRELPITIESVQGLAWSRCSGVHAQGAPFGYPHLIRRPIRR